MGDHAASRRRQDRGGQPRELQRKHSAGKGARPAVDDHSQAGCCSQQGGRACAQVGARWAQRGTGTALEEHVGQRQARGVPHHPRQDGARSAPGSHGQARQARPQWTHEQEGLVRPREAPRGVRPCDLLRDHREAKVQRSAGNVQVVPRDPSHLSEGAAQHQRSAGSGVGAVLRAPRPSEGVHVLPSRCGSRASEGEAPEGGSRGRAAAGTPGWQAPSAPRWSRTERGGWWKPWRSPPSGQARSWNARGAGGRGPSRRQVC
mmetsp:Transcript_11203/g.41820  ORF Transcript_11203/g.41820 Transcript_11203/m.41820 type:complete len:261 (+) Transcript_11203:792-1574(+)